MKNLLLIIVIAFVACYEEEPEPEPNCMDALCDIECTQKFNVESGDCEDGECICHYPEDCHPWNCGTCIWEIHFCEHYCDELPYENYLCRQAGGDNENCEVEGVCDGNHCACVYVPL